MKLFRKLRSTSRQTLNSEVVILKVNTKMMIVKKLSRIFSFAFVVSIYSASLYGCGVKGGIQQQEQKAKSLSDIIHDGAFLVDLRTVSEYKDGHVKGSINIPLSTVQNKIEQFRGKKYVVVFCQSGGRSSKAKNILESNGIKNVTNGGGWETVNAAINKK
jgi:phage shock protein E